MAITVTLNSIESLVNKEEFGLQRPYVILDVSINSSRILLQTEPVRRGGRTTWLRLTSAAGSRSTSAAPPALPSPSAHATATVYNCSGASANTAVDELLAKGTLDIARDALIGPHALPLLLLGGESSGGTLHFSITSGEDVDGSSSPLPTTNTHFPVSPSSRPATKPSPLSAGVFSSVSPGLTRVSDTIALAHAPAKPVLLSEPERLQQQQDDDVKEEEDYSEDEYDDSGFEADSTSSKGQLVVSEKPESPTSGLGLWGTKTDSMTQLMKDLNELEAESSAQSQSANAVSMPMAPPTPDRVVKPMKSRAQVKNLPSLQPSKPVQSAPVPRPSPRTNKLSQTQPERRVTPRTSSAAPLSSPQRPVTAPGVKPPMSSPRTARSDRGSLQVKPLAPLKHRSRRVSSPSRPTGRDTMIQAPHTSVGISVGTIRRRHTEKLLRGSDVPGPYRETLAAITTKHKPYDSSPPRPLKRGSVSPSRRLSAGRPRRKSSANVYDALRGLADGLQVWASLKPTEPLDGLVQSACLLEKCVCVSLRCPPDAEPHAGAIAALVRVYNDVALSSCAPAALSHLTPARQCDVITGSLTLLGRALCLLGVPSSIARALAIDVTPLSDGVITVPPAYHKLLSTTLNNVGCVLTKLQKSEAAATVFELALHFHKLSAHGRSHDGDHPAADGVRNSVHILRNLAAVYRHSGMLDHADAVDGELREEKGLLTSTTDGSTPL